MNNRTFLGASVVAAFIASLCCVLPIVFAVGGFAIVGAAAFFASLRPYLLLVTFALLAAGFYFAYCKPTEACEARSTCARPAVGRSGRIGLWLATAAVIAFSAFPYYSSRVSNVLIPKGATLAAETAGSVRQVRFAVHGMDCPACAKAVEAKLTSLNGVRKASVSYEQGRAEVEYDPASIGVEQLQQAIADAGYHAQKIGAEPES